MMVRTCFLFALAVALCACSSQLAPPSPGTFQRPAQTAFVCLSTKLPEDRLVNEEPAPEECLAPSTRALTAVPVTCCNRRLKDDFTVVDDPHLVLHALVTQSNRGEVAAVNLRAARVVDTRQDIPGYTFVPVGELPGPIVVPAQHPATTYVANRGSRDISVLRTKRLVEQSPGDDATRQRVRVQLGADAQAAAPFDIVLAPDEDALFVSAPSAGQLLRMPIVRTGCDETDHACRDGELDIEHITAIALDGSLALASMQPPADTASAVDDPYRFQCAGTPRLAPRTSTTPALPPMDPTLTPQPAGLAIDAFCAQAPANTPCQRRLLVADERLPLIHAIDLDALAQGKTSEALLPPIVTGTPTKRVVVTPRVPVSTHKSDGDTQYVYAIDAIEGGVLVTQNGKLLQVGSDPSLRPDRVDLGLGSTSLGPPGTVPGRASAISLTILTPHFDVTASSQQWVPVASDPRDNAPAQDPRDVCEDASHTLPSNWLRGVFLAVGMTDGTVRIVDVHDEELRDCRVRQCDDPDQEFPDCPHVDQCSPSCMFGSASCYSPYPVVRHRARVDNSPSTAPTVQLVPTVTPRFRVGSDVVAINNDGTTNDARVSGLGLACVACGANQLAAFPVLTGESSSGSAAGSSAMNATAAGAGGTGGSGRAAGAGGTGGGGTGATGGAQAPLCGMCGTGSSCICSLVDPWADPLQQWTATYEGLIPGTQGGRGRFSQDNPNGALEFRAESGFCEAGVLGGKDSKHVGDQLLIVSKLPPAQKSPSAEQAKRRKECETVVAARDNDLIPLAFRIVSAFNDRLVLDPQSLNPVPGLADRRPDYEFVSSCFGDMLMAYEVHAYGSYIVTGGPSLGFVHRVIADEATGRCRIDATEDPKRTGRADPTDIFNNGYIAFRAPAAPASKERHVQLEILSATSAPKLLFNAVPAATASDYGVMPVDIRFSQQLERMYVVDATVRGLIDISVEPLPASVAASYQ